MNMRRRAFASVMAMLIGLAMLLGIVAGTANTAHAETLAPVTDDYRVGIPFKGTIYYIGVAGTDAKGNNYYCVEATKDSDLVVTSPEVVQDSEKARRMAWILDQYHDADRDTHAAVAMVVQEYFGDKAQWAEHYEIVRREYPQILSQAGRIWAQSEGKVPADAIVTRTDAEGKRRGKVKVDVVNYDGDSLAGVPFVVKLDGPARFTSNGGTSIEGTSTGSPQSFDWEATGYGEAEVTVSYEHGRVAKYDNLTQDFLTRQERTSSQGRAITFDVHRDFAPLVSTEVANKEIDEGQPVVDKVTSGIQNGDRWLEGLAIKARGYYYAGLPFGGLGRVVRPDAAAGEQFIAQLGGMGYHAVAFGEATFTGPGQTISVEARGADGKPYASGHDDGFGTWVWVIDRGDQSDEARIYLDHDFASDFLEIPETVSNRREVKVSSVITEHSVTVGSELSDTIKVEGFPEDHGQFTGNEEYGFAADRPYAKVSVWWSGDPDDASKDERYEPYGAEVPEHDAYHRMVGSWDLPAANGVYRVGAGALDAHGNPMNVKAEKHGWYVFVWEFKGDSRVMPAISRYDDGWERARAFEPEECEDGCPPICVDDCSGGNANINVNTNVNNNVNTNTDVETQSGEDTGGKVREPGQEEKTDPEPEPESESRESERPTDSENPKEDEQPGKPRDMKEPDGAQQPDEAENDSNESGEDGAVDDVAHGDEPGQVGIVGPVGVKELGKTGSGVPTAIVVAGVVIAAAGVSLMSIALIKRRS